MNIVIKVTRYDRSSLVALGAYRLVYLKSRRILAPKDSLGCMCFKSKRMATEFALRFPLHRKSFRYLRVEGIGKPRFPVRISFSTTEDDLHSFYQDLYSYGQTSVPEGTVCYPEVRVLD